MQIIDRVRLKVERGERLTDQDALELFESADIMELGALADSVNRKKNQDVAFYNVNRHINPTNICSLSCKFCAYSRKIGEEGGYAYSIEEMVGKAKEAVDQGATEVHMVGGLHPRWRFEHYKDMIKAVKTAFPDLHIKAFTAVELDWLARKARKSIREVLTELRDCGLGSLPGGGAEIFDPEIRDAICETKVSAEQWLDTHKTAHELGMHSNCTMLYGHIESYHHRVDHMRRIRELQDISHGFNAFIPLAFQPFDNEMGIERYTNGYDDLKTLAIARLYLDNFRHVKAYWIMLGQDIAQLGLQFGANDLDGTVIEEKISRMAGGRAGMAMTRPYIENMILKAKRVPCERDTLYHPIGTPDFSKRMVPSPEAVRSARQALDKSASEPLASAELSLLPVHCSLQDLARKALLIKESKTSPNGDDHAFQGLVTPTVFHTFGKANSVTSAMESIRGIAEKQVAARTIAIVLPDDDHRQDLLPDGMQQLSQLQALLQELKLELPLYELAIFGIKELWRCAQAENVPLRGLISQLKEAGLSYVVSGFDDKETDLTHRELVSLLRDMHEVGIKTIAKVELMAPAQGAGEPLWDTFLRRLAAIEEVEQATEGMLAVMITAAQGCFITATEYLTAVALARIALRSVPEVIAPLAVIPALSPESDYSKKTQQYPQEKLGGLALHAGASGLGHIDVERFRISAIGEQIRASGHMAKSRLYHSKQMGELTDIYHPTKHSPRSVLGG